jgi:hypothetical protein
MRRSDDEFVGFLSSAKPMVAVPFRRYLKKDIRDAHKKANTNAVLDAATHKRVQSEYAFNFVTLVLRRFALVVIGSKHSIGSTDRVQSFYGQALCTTADAVAFLEQARSPHTTSHTFPHTTMLLTLVRVSPLYLLSHTYAHPPSRHLHRRKLTRCSS